VDQTHEPLQDVYLYVQSDDDKLGLLRTDEYGYFGMERYEFDGTGSGEANRLYMANEGYEDRSEYIGYGQFYFFDLLTGESGLNFATITGRFTDGKTGIGGQITRWNDDDTSIGGVMVTCGEQSVTTGPDGYYLMELSNTGSLTLTGEKEGFIDRYKEVNIYDGNLINQNLSMATFDEGVPLTITGTVSAGGVPVPEATVRVPNNEETTSDVNGDYSLTITVYDESVSQWVELICEKSGYETGSVFLSFSPEFQPTHAFWLKEE
jgi:hypothetical protein